MNVLKMCLQTRTLSETLATMAAHELANLLMHSLDVHLQIELARKCLLAGFTLGHHSSFLGPNFLNGTSIFVVAHDGMPLDVTEILAIVALVAKPRVNGFVHKADMPSKNFFSVISLVTLVALVDQVVSLEVLAFVDLSYVPSNAFTSRVGLVAKVAFEVFAIAI